MTEVVPLGARRSGARSLAAVPNRLAVVFNPTAGRRKAKRLAAALALLRGAGETVDLERTTARGDAERLAYDAPREQTLIIAGGDGTANEAANGRLAAGGGRLALIPLGTANVLAAELGIETSGAGGPGGGERPAAPLPPRHRQWPGLRHDGGRRLRCPCGGGVSPRVKRLIGKGAYVLEMLRQLARFPFPVYRVTIDGAAHEAASVVVARGRYYGGRFVVAPDASLDRAELHVCLFRRGGIFRTLRYAIALGMGNLAKLPDIEIVVGQRVVIDGPPGDPVQGDGDIIARLPVTIELSPVSLELMRP